METKGTGVFKTIGICGGGKMGVSFFKYISRYGYDILFYIRNPEKLARTERNYLRELAAKNKSFHENSGQDPCVRFTGQIVDLKNADIIFEFVSEDLTVKKDVICELLSNRSNPDQIIATCSSSFTPGRLDDHYDANNILGIHFIYPVQFMRSVEILYGRDSRKDLLEKAKNFIQSIGKTPVLLREEADVFSVKVLSSIQNEAFRIHREYGISPGKIDGIIVESFAMPPFDMMDSVGMEIILTCTREFYADSEEYPYYSGLEECLRNKIAAGETGKKTGKGFFNYSGGEKKDAGDFTGEIDSYMKNLITERIKMVYINTCFRYLDHCWLDSEEVDGIMKEVNQAERGPIEIAYSEGVENVLEILESCREKYGLPFKPPNVLKYAVYKKVGRDEIDRQIRLSKLGGTRPGWDHTA